MNLLRQALQFTLTYDLANLSLMDFKKHPSVKVLYDELVVQGSS